VSAKAGWYPDPGGGVGLYRYWDGNAWSAATTPNPAAGPPPSVARGPVPVGPPIPGGSAGAAPGNAGDSNAGSAGSTGGYQQAAGHGSAGGYGPAGRYGPTGTVTAPGSAYANYQQVTKKRSAVGWWIGAVALLAVIVVVAVLAIRSISGGGALSGQSAGQPSENVCPQNNSSTTTPLPHPNDGRVHGGPVSYPELGDPWGLPQEDSRVPFGSDVQAQTVLVEQNYQPGDDWVASILVGELQAGDGFYTPQQGAQIVVKCILGKFYGNNPVNSNVRVDQATTIDGHDGWLVESHLTFDIPGLQTKGELLLVAIVATGDTAGLYYASIPDTTPQLVAPARQSLAELKVDG
jgi:hypothetical protein